VRTFVLTTNLRKIGVNLSFKASHPQGEVQVIEGEVVQAEMTVGNAPVDPGATIERIEVNGLIIVT